MSIMSCLRILVVLAGACAFAQGKTVYVSTTGNDAHDGLSWATAKKAVQAGLNAATDGDQMWVAAGTYLERITLQPGVGLYGGFAGSETALSQRNWPANVTILDGNQAGSVVTAPTGAMASTRIDGFTIRNGNASGSGMYCYYSSPTIANNTITGNMGGIYCGHSSPTIANNTITGNSGSGGISCYYSSSPTIISNTITGNTALNWGGGICCDSSSPTIINNTIVGNTAPDGGGIYCQYSSPAIAGNAITGNSGSGISCYSFSPTIANNTITGNFGSGISCNSCSPRITNTIIAFNASGISSGYDAPVLRYCCVYGNAACNYSGLSDPTGTNGNISVDPQLADVARGNLHLQPTSPCIDAGDDSAVQTGWADIDGQARVQGGHVDIGADESDGTSWPAAAIVYVSPNGSDSNDGLSWAKAKQTVQAGLDAGGTGSQVWVAAGTYVGTIQLRFGVVLYGGFAGGETDLSQRNWRTNVTILDGNQAGSAVTTPPAATAGTRIDGFTIRNGKASQYGGGIYCNYSSPTITNNIISGNVVSSSYSSRCGGGIYCSNSSSPAITNNIITGNTASDCGGGIYCYSSLPTIADNTISGNEAYYGGGIYCSSCSPIITNNTITGNAADWSGCGGIECSQSSSPAITNTIIAFNSSGISSSYSKPRLRCCCVYGNGAYNFSGLSDPTGTNGNISADPQLADVASGNSHLQPTSPCIDAGDDTAVQAGWTDMDGQPRTHGAHVDIGADEADGTLWPVVAIVYVSPGGNDGNDGFSWATAKRTVQAGIDAGGTGSQVWVAAGTYVETIQMGYGIALYGGFVGTETDLSQRNWRTNVTILDGNQAGSVVTAPLAATASTRIDGFTIRNGNASSGGGIYCNFSSPTVANNTITGNIAFYNSGGGVYCSYSSPIIVNNTITGNTASSYGGAISCDASSFATIANNTITGNTGGGIYCGSSLPAITNNTIVGNLGDGIYCYSSPTITNTIIAFNSSGIFTYGGAPTLHYCCVYGNGAYNFSGVSDPTGTNGNISADPQLADVARSNVHVQATSPCVDAGDDTAIQSGWTDIDGQARMQGAHVDIGADESDGMVWPTGPAIVYVSPSGSDSNDGLSWGSAKRTVQAAINASGTGSQVWVAAGTYVGTIQLRFGIALYGGFAGSETDLLQRNWRTNVTILDGNQAGSVVTAPPAAMASTRIDGFTIRNGKASSEAGGIYCYASSPTIINNTVTGNTATWGGGIYCVESSPTITNNTISGNTASSIGGGICCHYSSATITNNNITGNSGGGISCYSCSPAIGSNTIAGNTAFYGGGGIYCTSTSSPTIMNNTIAGNTASCGGGIYCDSSSPTITNNTITGNTGSSYNGGGGIYCYYSSPAITNTIIALNSSGLYSFSGTPTLRYCCIYGNGGCNFSGLTDPTGTNGNISVDPLFMHQTAPYDFHLLASSPCVNTGDPSFNGNGSVDLDGKVRVFGGRVDMGAYEFVPNPPTIITSDPLVAGKVGAAYSQTFQASGGVSPYTWRVSAGSLPAGLSLNSSGVLSGTPSAIVTASFTVQAMGRDGSTVTKDFTLAAAPPDLPSVPGNPSPAAGQTDVSLSPTLSWGGAAPWVTFDVYLDTANPPVTKVVSGISAANVSRSGLIGGKRYYWQVVAINVSGQTPGPVWSFATHLAGDINGDGFVNVGDLQRLVKAWGSDNSGAWGNWDPNADLNNDGQVNVSDLQILVASWGHSLN